MIKLVLYYVSSLESLLINFEMYPENFVQFGMQKCKLIKIKHEKKMYINVLTINNKTPQNCVITKKLNYKWGGVPTNIR